MIRKACFYLTEVPHVHVHIYRLITIIVNMFYYGVNLIMVNLAVTKATKCTSYPRNLLHPSS